jgi:hypothetical protein
MTMGWEFVIFLGFWCFAHRFEWVWSFQNRAISPLIGAQNPKMDYVYQIQHYENVSPSLRTKISEASFRVVRYTIDDLIFNVSPLNFQSRSRVSIQCISSVQMRKLNTINTPGITSNLNKFSFPHHSSTSTTLNKSNINTTSCQSTHQGLYTVIDVNTAT